ncbi:CD63 antigen [Phaenicophaeus curvirostris]|uniref:CD63 antigen n=1 Tax=Phaenicophaeus curvirostris TaxID=33595 RepID=UPI0037F09F79
MGQLGPPHHPNFQPPPHYGATRTPPSPQFSAPPLLWGHQDPPITPLWVRAPDGDAARGVGVFVGCRVRIPPPLTVSPPQVCGVALIAVGVYAQVELAKALAVSGGSAAGSPLAILVLGVIIFFIAFFGCCGAWKESYCLVTTFAVLLSLIFLVEVAAAIAGYVFKDKVRSVLEKGLQDAMQEYGEDKPLTEAVDELQSEFKCCGANNYTDWETIERFRANDTVPRSCCRVTSATCNEHPSPDTVYDKGCLQSIEAWMKKNILIVAAVALGIAFFEILGIIFACCLMKGIRSGYEVM